MCPDTQVRGTSRLRCALSLRRAGAALLEGSRAAPPSPRAPSLCPPTLARHTGTSNSHKRTHAPRPHAPRQLTPTPARATPRCHAVTGAAAGTTPSTRLALPTCRRRPCTPAKPRAVFADPISPEQKAPLRALHTESLLLGKLLSALPGKAKQGCGAGQSTTGEAGACPHAPMLPRRSPPRLPGSAAAEQTPRQNPRTQPSPSPSPPASSARSEPRVLTRLLPACLIYCLFTPFLNRCPLEKPNATRSALPSPLINVCSRTFPHCSANGVRQRLAILRAAKEKQMAPGLGEGERLRKAAVAGQQGGWGGAFWGVPFPNPGGWRCWGGPPSSHLPPSGWSNRIGAGSCT